jgi:glycosyltransferase involved in cell wall biosynthesis
MDTATPDVAPAAMKTSTTPPTQTRSVSAVAGSGKRWPILYLNHSAQMSGAEASLRSLLWGLRRSGSPHDPVIALPDGGPFLELLRDEGWNVTLAPLRRLQRPRGIIDGMSSLLHVLQTTPHICRLVAQTGARIVHSNSTTAHLVGGLAGERTGRPTIWHCRDLVPLSRLAPQLAARATRVIAISGCVADMLEKEGVPHEKIVIVRNGIDPDEWHLRERSLLRESLPFPNDSFVFGMVGQLVPWKNHIAFIEAAAQLVQDQEYDRARFITIGGDLWGEQTPYVRELRDLVKKHDLADRFNFIPNLVDGADAIAALDVLVHPAHDEPFGRVIMEAMALRRAVIAMNENGPREIVTHEHDGLLVSPSEEHGLAKAMKRIMDDRDLFAHLKHHSRTSIENRFHIDDHSAKITEIYRGMGA